MNARHPGTPSTALSLLAAGLLVAGLLEALAIALLVPRRGIAAMHEDITAPTTLWTLWLAVILTVLSDAVHPAVRYAVAVAALAAGSFRSGLHVIAWNSDLVGTELPLAVLQSVPQFLGPVLLALWALVDALRRRDAARARAAAPAIPAPRMLPPLTAPDASPGTSTIRRAGPSRTPASAPVLPGQSWRSVGSPWPRAVEEDPDGTLVRPPRRRTAN